MSNIVDVVVPTVGESVTEIFEVRILKGVGEYVKEGEVMLEGDSDKASIEIVSPITGQVTEILVEEGADFPIGNVIAKVEEKAIPAAPTVGAAPVVDVPAETSSVTSTSPAEITKAAPVAAEPPKTVTPVGAETRVKMTPLRRTIARRLVEAQQTAAMLTTFNEADMTAIFELRKKYQEIC